LNNNYRHYRLHIGLGSNLGRNNVFSVKNSINMFFQKQKFSPNLPKKFPNCFKIDSSPSRDLYAMLLGLKSL
jgi:hypothetical protein